MVSNYGTTENFDKGTFARPVFSDEGMDLTFPKIEIHIIQRTRGTESFADMIHPE
jgi:hypothetical protein